MISENCDMEMQHICARISYRFLNQPWCNTSSIIIILYHLLCQYSIFIAEYDIKPTFKKEPGQLVPSQLAPWTSRPMTTRPMIFFPVTFRPMKFCPMIFPSMDISPHGQFSQWTFCLWTFHPMDISHFAPRTFCPNIHFIPQKFHPTTFCPIDISPSGQITSWTTQPRDIWPHRHFAFWLPFAIRAGQVSLG
jgi:hypothetical protein